MPLYASNRRVCRHCDGFCVVAITTGGRHRDGSRVLLHVVCHACQGTGHAAPARIAHAGK
jgi:RNase P subunit RPR2